MRFYKVFTVEADLLATYRPTLSDAHDCAKEKEPAPALRGSVRIVEVEVATDKAGVLAILNREHEEQEIRTWTLTARGGLKELTDGVL